MKYINSLLLILILFHPLSAQEELKDPDALIAGLDVTDSIGSNNITLGKSIGFRFGYKQGITLWGNRDHLFGETIELSYAN